MADGFLNLSPIGKPTRGHGMKPAEHPRLLSFQPRAENVGKELVVTISNMLRVQWDDEQLLLFEFFENQGTVGALTQKIDELAIHTVQNRGTQDDGLQIGRQDVQNLFGQVAGQLP